MGEARRAISPPRLGLGSAVALTAVAGSTGLVCDRIARHFGASFPSGGYLIAELAWNIVTISVVVSAIRRVDRVALTTVSLGLTRQPQPRQPYPVAFAAATAAVAVVAVVLVGSSPTNGSVYGHAHHVTPALAVGELAIRYPLTVFAEETLFRGWMQPRLGRSGPVLSGLLWAAYHLQQVSTIPTLVLFGLALGFIRWLFGDVRGSGTVHYASDAIFFVTTYL